MADVPAQAVLNEAALKRFDPYVKEILDTAKYVALYSFNPDLNEWEKTNVEGSLFVYSRTGEPYHNILVLNRLNTTNLIEPITHKLDLQLQEPFLLYRNNKLKIFGIWFYEKEECTRFATLVRELMKKSGGCQTQGPPRANGGSVDIFSMLSKAQEAYNTTKNVKKEEGTPQSVVEFFAKAGAPPRTLLARSHSATAQEASEKLNPLIHQLMSNPVCTVEQIEKQQRSVTPQTDATQALKHFIRPLSAETESQADDAPHPKKLENGVNFLGLASPSLKPNSLLTGLDSGFEFRALSETPQKPALMPPAMFTPSASLEPGFSYPNKPEPLTRNQLLQALNYLLKNDSDFVNKIHEAYIKSLSDKVS